MKLKLALGIALITGVSAAANAAPPPLAINLGTVLPPVINLIDIYGVAVNPVLQPVLAISSPIAGNIVVSLHPSFVVLGQLVNGAGLGLNGVQLLPALPGLPQ